MLGQRANWARVSLQQPGQLLQCVERETLQISEFKCRLLRTDSCRIDELTGVSSEGGDLGRQVPGRGRAPAGVARGLRRGGACGRRRCDCNESKQCFENFSASRSHKRPDPVPFEKRNLFQHWRGAFILRGTASRTPTHTQQSQVRRFNEKSVSSSLLALCFWVTFWRSSSCCLHSRTVRSCSRATFVSSFR